MTNAMLFEGPLLDEVLAEARLCFGPDVEIEAANRVRRGGMFGFFATEWYEVWARPSAATVANPALRLVSDDGGADTFQDMVRNALADREINGNDPTSAQQEYESALDRFFDDEDGRDGRRRPGGGTAPTRELVGAGAPAAPAPARELVGAAALAAPAPAPIPTLPTPATAPAAAAVAPAPMPFTPPTAARATLAGLAATAMAPPAPAPIVEERTMTTPASVALEDAPRGDTVFAPERAPKTDLLWAMLGRLDQLPPAPSIPTDHGVIAFVGEAGAALETARQIGKRTGLWGGDVAVVSRRADARDRVPSWLLVDDLDELAGRADRWRQRGRVLPVVIDQGVEAGERVWARQALVDLQADQVRMVVEAWRLPEDVGRVAAKLGGVDALELTAVADSVEPLALLDLDIPLSTIEARPATPELLAAVWLENRRRV